MDVVYDDDGSGGRSSSPARQGVDAVTAGASHAMDVVWLGVRLHFKHLLLATIQKIFGVPR